jgi:hypothetical protein
MERITSGLPVAKGTFIDVQIEYSVSEKLQTLEETLIQPLNEPESIQRILDLPGNEETADNIIRDLDDACSIVTCSDTIHLETTRHFAEDLIKIIIFRHGDENLAGSSSVNFHLLDWYPRSAPRTESPQALREYSNFETTGSAFHAKSPKMNRPSSVGTSSTIRPPFRRWRMAAAVTQILPQYRIHLEIRYIFVLFCTVGRCSSYGKPLIHQIVE